MGTEVQNPGQGTGAYYDHNGVKQGFLGIVVLELLTIEAEPVEVPNVVQGYRAQGTRGTQLQGSQPRYRVLGYLL